MNSCALCGIPCLRASVHPCIRGESFKSRSRKLAFSRAGMTAGVCRPGPQGKRPRPRIVPNHPPSPGIDRGLPCPLGSCGPLGPLWPPQPGPYEKVRGTSPFSAGLPAGRFIAGRSPQLTTATTRRARNKTPGPYLPYRRRGLQRDHERNLSERALSVFLIATRRGFFGDFLGKMLKNLRPESERAARESRPCRRSVRRCAWEVCRSS